MSRRHQDVRRSSSGVRPAAHGVRIFVGSSTSALPVANRLAAALRETAGAEAVVWPDAFRPGQMLLDGILELVRLHDFGIFMFTPADALQFGAADVGRKPRLAKRPVAVVRDNVLFEAGVFMGGLGRERTFLVVPSAERARMRIPPDIQGLLTVDYRAEPEDLGAAVRQISRAVRELGPALRTTHDEITLLVERVRRREFRARRRGVPGGARLWVLADLVAEAAALRDRPWYPETEPQELLQPIYDEYGQAIADDAYWWLVVLGVFRFKGIDAFTSEESWSWDESIDYVEFSERGAALANVLARQHRLTAQAAAPTRPNRKRRPVT